MWMTVSNPAHTLQPLGISVAGQASGPFKDGGLYDRTGLSAWRQRRAQQGGGVPPALVHLIARSSGFSGADDVESTGQALSPPVKGSIPPVKGSGGPSERLRPPQ